MATFHVFAGSDAGIAHPDIKKIGLGDLQDALRQGWRDFLAMPTHLAFLVLIYPIAGILFALWTSGNNALPMLFPLASGFVLIGPLAAVGLYEISKRREQGKEVHWSDGLAVRHSPALPSIVLVGAWLLGLFVAWLLVARTLYIALFGDVIPASLDSFLTSLPASNAGWSLILAGNALGAVFALVALATTCFAFPMLIDRDVGAAAAIQTSVRAFMVNPMTMIAWGVMVAVILAIASIPLFVGLAVALPVLGHATWHLYRKVIG